MLPRATNANGVRSGQRRSHTLVTTMSSISDQIKRHLAQPDLNASRRKTLSYLNDNHAFSQSTAELEDTLQSLRHERDSLRVSVRNSTHLPCPI
jgi:predicted transcriptional regulator